MSTWQIARRQVAIAGRVTDGVSGKPLSGVHVTIVTMPPLFKNKLEVAALQYGNRWATMTERADKTQTRHDGLFYFLDLPDGKYGLSASLSSPGKRYSKADEAVVVARDAKGGMKLTFTNFVLQQTMLKGKVTCPGHKTGVAMAEVRVKGSGERAFSDVQGQYLLAGIEPGKRTVLVFAQGYREAEQAVTIAGPGESQTLNFALAKEGG